MKLRRKVKGTMINPTLCVGCRFVKVSGGYTVSSAPTGSTARCKASARVQKKCKNWTTDIDSVERIFGMFDVSSPEDMACTDCVNFDDSKCPHTKYYDSDPNSIVKNMPGYAPRIDRNACLHYRHVKYLAQDAIEGMVKVVE